MGCRDGSLSAPGAARTPFRWHPAGLRPLRARPASEAAPGPVFLGPTGSSVPGHGCKEPRAARARSRTGVHQSAGRTTEPRLPGSPRTRDAIRTGRAWPGTGTHPGSATATGTATDVRAGPCACLRPRNHQRSTHRGGAVSVPVVVRVAVSVPVPPALDAPSRHGVRPGPRARKPQHWMHRRAPAVAGAGLVRNNAGCTAEPRRRGRPCGAVLRGRGPKWPVACGGRFRGGAEPGGSVAGRGLTRSRRAACRIPRTRRPGRWA